MIKINVPEEDEDVHDSGGQETQHPVAHKANTILKVLFILICPFNHDNQSCIQTDEFKNSKVIIIMTSQVNLA